MCERFPISLSVVQVESAGLLVALAEADAVGVGAATLGRGVERQVGVVDEVAVPDEGFEQSLAAIFAELERRYAFSSIIQLATYVCRIERNRC